MGGPYGGELRLDMLLAGVVLGLVGALFVALIRFQARRIVGRRATVALDEERFRTLFEETQQALTLIEKGRFVAANKAALAMLRYERVEDLVGLTPMDISPRVQPDGRLSAEKAEEVIQRALAHGSNQFEWEHIRADGEHFMALVLLTAIRAGDHQSLHVVWSDISAQKRAERELAEYRDELERRVAARTAELAATTESLRSASEEQQAVFDAATVGIVLTRNRTILRCNRTLERTLGYEPGELLGKSTAVLYGGAEAFAEVGARIAADFARQGFYREERDVVRKDGGRVWARLGAQAIDAHDPSKGMAGTIEDISAERVTTMEMARARTLAEDAARTKADFLANMSHEIRTPMNAVIGLTHLLLRTELTLHQREYLRKVQASSQMLMGVLNDILDFSKIDAGQLVVEHVDFELERLLNNVAALVAEKTASKGLELVVKVAPNVPNNLVGDPLRVGQILTNYANNAVKFTEHGEVAISAEVVSQQGRALRLRFLVRDTGIGIAEDKRDQLFNSFQQADTSITRKYGGTGLGLAISKRLAVLMDGEVGVESEPGVGSTFWFTVSLAAGKDSSKRFLPRADLRGRRVLLVDNNELAREVIGDMLRGMTFAVKTAASGAQALAELTRAEQAGEPIELVFLDWQMPVLDGQQTAEAIGRLGLRVQPPLVMLAAYGQDPQAQSPGQVRIAEVLVKPVSPSQLFDAIMRALGVNAATRHTARFDADELLPDVSSLVGARVLLAEDNELNQEVAREFLQTAGVEVDLAEDGAVALRKVQERSYDLVLMDMQMPVMDGLTATAEIRKLEGLRELPIVAMTANAMAGDRVRCMDAGMNDHIAKPITPQILLSKLLEWIPARQGSALPPPVGPVSRPPSPSAHVLDGIAGLDVALGLRQMAGRDALYLSVLAKFAAKQGDVPPRIAAAVAAGDWTLAEREVHTLKGVAATIGATRLRATAEQLERAIRTRQPSTEMAALQTALADALPPLLAAIAKQLPPKIAAPPVPLDPTAARDVCVQLALRLNNDDFASRALLDANEGMLQAALGGDFPRISEAVGNCDFADALAFLEEAARSHGIALH